VYGEVRVALELKFVEAFGHEGVVVDHHSFVVRVGGGIGFY